MEGELGEADSAAPPSIWFSLNPNQLSDWMYLATILVFNARVGGLFLSDLLCYLFKCLKLIT